MLIALGLFIPFCVVLIVAMCCWAIWLCTTRPWREVAQACCGRCRYPVEGNATTVCPECGADVHVVGVLTASMQRRMRGNLLAAVVAWLLLTTCGTLILHFAVVPSELFYVTTYRLTTPASGQAAPLDAWIYDGERGMLLMLRMTTGGGTAYFEVDLQRQHCVVADSNRNVIKSGAFEPGIIREFFRAAGLDTESGQFLTEIDEVTGFVRRWIANPQGSERFRGPAMIESVPSRTPRQPPSFLHPERFNFGIVVLVGGGLAGAAGSIWIIRRRRKLLRDADAAAPPTAPVAH